MNWKKEAQAKLQDLEAMRLATVNIPEEIARLEIDATAIRSARTDATPVRGGGSRREDALLSNIVHRQELSRTLQQAQLWVSSTERALNVLNNEQKLILHSLYIHPRQDSMTRLCTELGLEQSSVYRKRDQALRRFMIAYYGLDS